MTMPGRKFSSASSSYRYGFNGKENDKDAGVGIQDYGYRMNDVRLGRLLSVDPIARKYPWYSPYQFAGNDVLRCVDLLGLQPTSRIEKWITDGVKLGTIKAFDVYDKVRGQRFEAYGVVDPNTGIEWIVADDGQGQGKYFYLKNDDNSTNKISYRVFNGENRLVKGHFERFKTQNTIDKESGAAIADGIGYGAAAIVALPGILEAGAVGVTYLEASATKLAVNILTKYWAHAGTVGTVGKMGIDMFDQSGQSGNAAAAAESYFSSGTLSKGKEWVYGLLNFRGKSGNARVLETGGEMIINGKQLTINAAAYVQGLSNEAAAGELGRDGLKALENSYIKFGKDNGFEKMIINYQRSEGSSSANPGGTVTRSYDLTQ